MAISDFGLTFGASAVEALRKRATLARMAWTDLSGAFTPADHRETLRINYVQPGAVNRNAADAENWGTPNQPTNTKIEMKVDQFWEQEYLLKDRDHDTMSVEDARTIGRTYGNKFGDEIEAFLFETLGAYCQNYSGTAGTAPFASNVDLIADVRAEFEKRDVDMGSLAWINDPANAKDLLKRQDFVAADYRGAEGARSGLSGMIGRRLGFDFATSNNIPAKQSAGTILVNGAASAGATEINVDGVNATAGIRRGERITIGSNSYGVVEGFSGASGKLVLDRGLVAAVADNAAVTTHAARGFALDPSYLAVAFRPSVSQTADYADIMPIVDPETGFSLTLEQVRQKHRTVYNLSAVFGARTLRDAEGIQGILGTGS